jgi:hypothetical protein
MSGPQIPATQIRGAAAGTGHGIIDSGWWDICKENVNFSTLPTSQNSKDLFPQLQFIIYIQDLYEENGPQGHCPSIP